MNNYPEYIGATGENSINDYIDYTSNINYSYTSNSSNFLLNEIIFTSNILEISSSNKTSNLRSELWEVNPNNNNCLIKTKKYNNKNHTYIINSNINGEIRFSTIGSFSSTDDPINDYSIKIDDLGKLYVYHKYNLLQPFFPAGFYDVEGELFGIKNQELAFDTTLTGLQTYTQNFINLTSPILALHEDQIGLLQYQIDMIGTVSGTDMYLIEGSQTFERLQENLINTIQKSNFYNTNLTSTGLTLAVAVGIPSALFLTASSMSDYLNREYFTKIINNFSNSNIPSLTQQEKNILYTSNYDGFYNSLSNFNYSISNLSLSQGFLNSNTITQQYLNAININELKLNQTNISNIFVASNINTPQNIPNINTNNITYQGQELSTILNNYLQKAGGTMSGRINFNYGSSIFGTPTAGGGGSGERINLNINGITASDYPPSIGVSQNSLWFSSPNNQNYEWFNNGNQIMSLSSAGKLILNNPITTAERRYPPKSYTSSTNENVITFLGQSGMLSGTITLNPIGISYGSGVYEIYSSSRYNASEYQKRDLFNYNETTNEVGGHWASGQYNQFGVYQGVAYIKPDYLGDFLIVKLPNPIILTRFRFYPRIGLSFRIPAEFRFYGSMNGIDFTEITQASQITPRLTTNDIINGYYEKTLAAGFNTPYLYIGFCCNKLMGTNFPDCVNFQEFVMFGKEALSSTASLAIGTSDASTYALNVNGSLNASTILENNQSIPTISQNTILNSTPNVQKKYMFTGTCSSSILMPDNVLYYVYDIDLTNYTQLKYAPNPNTPYRIFNIKIFFGSVYFGYLTNGNPNVLSYEVYMSNESQGGGGGIGSAGLNVCALGYPPNPILNTISPTQLSLVCGDFNFVSVLSRVNGTVFNAIIEDCLF
jgi:hypothetical protein